MSKTCSIGCLFVLLATIALPGCKRKVVVLPPPVYPVTGKVVAPAGLIPPGSSVQFSPKDFNLTAQGRTDADGNFTLRMMFHELWYDGATEGPHKVTIHTSKNKAPWASYEVKEPFTVEPKPEGNHFTVKVDQTMSLFTARPQ